jgi:uncharacterized protein
MESKYELYPFRFGDLDKENLLVNDIGDYFFINKNTFNKFVNKKLKLDDKIFNELKARGFCDIQYNADYINWIATRYRTKKYFLKYFTSLHMIVVTLRCNHQCNYCHASSVSSNFLKYNMNFETAHKCVDVIMHSPAKYLKIEFQGGEPLLNFEIVKEIIEYSQSVKGDKEIEYVICTNLLELSRDMLDYLKQKKVCISTSLDGPGIFFRFFQQNAKELCITSSRSPDSCPEILALHS